MWTSALILLLSCTVFTVNAAPQPFPAAAAGTNGAASPQNICVRDVEEVDIPMLGQLHLGDISFRACCKRSGVPRALIPAFCTHGAVHDPSTQGVSLVKRDFLTILNCMIPEADDGLKKCCDSKGLSQSCMNFCSHNVVGEIKALLEENQNNQSELLNAASALKVLVAKTGCKFAEQSQGHIAEIGENVWNHHSEGHEGQAPTSAAGPADNPGTVDNSAASSGAIGTQVANQEVNNSSPGVADNPNAVSSPRSDRNPDVNAGVMNNLAGNMGSQVANPPTVDQGAMSNPGPNNPVVGDPIANAVSSPNNAGTVNNPAANAGVVGNPAANLGSVGNQMADQGGSPQNPPNNNPIDAANPGASANSPPLGGVPSSSGLPTMPGNLPEVPAPLSEGNVPFPNGSPPANPSA